ncbi:hypothetical protein EON65_11100 [archaeon]|nr:MAG: hypothetical protein EON65_11100 [archaeon]
MHWWLPLSLPHLLFPLFSPLLSFRTRAPALPAAAALLAGLSSLRTFPASLNLSRSSAAFQNLVHMPNAHDKRIPMLRGRGSGRVGLGGLCATLVPLVARLSEPLYVQHTALSA